MKIWGIIRKENKIRRDVVLEFPIERPDSVDGWAEIIGEFAREFDLSRPVVLSKHVRDLVTFGHTAFRAADFMESIDFDRFEIEIFPEKSKDADPYHA